MPLQPPRLPLRFFRWFCDPALADSIEGDLHELFRKRVQRSGVRKARLLFVIDVLLLFRPGIIRSRTASYPTNHLTMIRNYLLIGWRNLLRHRLYSAIKIAGFAIGLTACMLIALYVTDETSYDRHYPEAERIYRVIGVNSLGGDPIRGVPFPAPMAAALKSDFPEIQEAGRYNPSELFGAGHAEIRAAGESENAFETGVLYFDQELLDIFQPTFVYGNPAQALTKPKSIVITRRKAERYFPNEDPVGKAMVLNNDDANPYVVGGVIENFPAQSHLQADFLIGTRGLAFWKDEQADWGASNYVIYVKLRPGADVVSLEKKMTRGIIENYVIPALRKDGVPDAELAKISGKAWLELQPVTDIHLHSAGIFDMLTHGDIRIVWLFSGIALFILLIAAINFINLSTARSANRAKEVGIRKAAGSHHSQLVGQFLTESALVSMIALALGMSLAIVLLPFFNTLTGKSLAWTQIPAWMFVAIPAATLLTGLLAGVYPAFYMASFQPIRALKGQLTRGSAATRLRSGLVVFQFTTSIVLIVATMVIYRQMNYVMTKDLGFGKDQVLIIDGAGTLGTQLPTFADELRALPVVQSVSLSDFLPVKGTMRNGNTFWPEGKVNSDRGIAAQRWSVDDQYLRTLGMQLLEGRDFNHEQASDTAAMILNESMAKAFGGSVLGTRISNGGRVYTVIGIVRDFHFESLRQRIEPLCLTLGNRTSTLAVKARTADAAALVTAVTTAWNKVSPNQPIRYTFLDDRFEAMHTDLERTGQLFTAFAILAIAIACLGLFALSAFMIEQRTKEIGIRLVLGASSRTVFGLLTSNFLVLVGIAFLIATPLAYYFMQQWLETFAYRIAPGIVVFVLAGLTALMIALLTVSVQSWRASRANPVNNLRAE